MHHYVNMALIRLSDNVVQMVFCLILKQNIPLQSWKMESKYNKLQKTNKLFNLQWGKNGCQSLKSDDDNISAITVVHYYFYLGVLSPQSQCRAR